MAVVSVQAGHQEYNIAEQALQDRLSYVYGGDENAVDLFRPALADHQKIGFFSLDRSSQTEITEVVDLKEMTEVLQVLLQDVASLRRDINFTKHVMHADYESKLKEKSLDLYCRINERVSELEKLHESRVETVRKAYRQQLSNAIARVAVLYNKNLERRMRSERNRLAAGADLMDEKYKEMQQTIQRNEGIIHMLKLQLAQYQQNAAVQEPVSPRRSALSHTGTDPTPTLMMDYESLRSETPAATAEEVEQMQEKIRKMEKKIGRLEEALDIKDEETTQLNMEVDTLTDQVEKQQMLIEQLKHEKNEMMSFAEQDKASSKRLLERQKQEMEKLMEEKIRLAREEAMNEAKKNNKGSLEADREKIKLLQDQKKILEELLAKEKAKNSNANQEAIDGDSLRKSEQRMREEVQRLKREIDRIQRTWEKKFAILQQSLHALKDESYLRHTLQRQAANLHQAAVSYSVDTPVGIMPAKGTNSKRPLPNIPKSGKSHRSHGASGEKDYISYTVSAPSGRGTAIFSADENQVMSDDQDMPEDVVPLPCPPPTKQNPADCGEDSRPSSQGHVVVLPSVEAL